MSLSSVSGQLAVALKFLTRDPSLIGNTAQGGELDHAVPLVFTNFLTMLNEQISPLGGVPFMCVTDKL